MWSLESVNAYALKRGELQNHRDPVRAALLAQERARGRVELPYPEDKATAELEQALARLGDDLPSRRDGEYPGLEELRDAVQARQNVAEPDPTVSQKTQAKTYPAWEPSADNEEDEDERGR